MVEKLSSSTQAEEWAEVVEQCDGSATFATESFRMKARRKYAVVNGLKFEDVTVEEVEKSPQGLKGWGEMVVTVPGIEEAQSKPAAWMISCQKRILCFALKGLGFLERVCLAFFDLSVGFDWSAACGPAYLEEAQGRQLPNPLWQ